MQLSGSLCRWLHVKIVLPAVIILVINYYKYFVWYLCALISFLAAKKGMPLPWPAPKSGTPSGSWWALHTNTHRRPVCGRFPLLVGRLCLPEWIVFLVQPSGQLVNAVDTRTFASLQLIVQVIIRHCKKKSRWVKMVTVELLACAYCGYALLAHFKGPFHRLNLDCTVDPIIINGKQCDTTVLINWTAAHSVSPSLACHLLENGQTTGSMLSWINFIIKGIQKTGRKKRNIVLPLDCNRFFLEQK